MQAYVLRPLIFQTIKSSQAYVLRPMIFQTMNSEKSHYSQDLHLIEKILGLENFYFEC